MSAFALETLAVDVMISIGPNFFYTVVPSGRFSR